MSHDRSLAAAVLETTVLQTESLTQPGCSPCTSLRGVELQCTLCYCTTGLSGALDQGNAQCAAHSTQPCQVILQPVETAVPHSVLQWM